MRFTGATLTLAVVGALAAAQVARQHGLFVPFPAFAILGSASRKGALTQQQRSRLPDRDFAIIEVRGGAKVRKYPIHDRRHGQIALTYVMSPSNAKYRERVKAAVFARYPDLRSWWDRTTRARQQGVPA
jgi:hypothetical protein